MRLVDICKTALMNSSGRKFKATRKADRLTRLAYRWLREHDCHPSDVRIDVVGVLAPPGRPVEIEHVAGIG